jgi:hypothetical protein
MRLGRSLGGLLLLWTGAAVAAEQLPRSSFARGLELLGAAVADTNYTCWGASPLVGEDGWVHLFVERWLEPHVDPAWRKSSEIAHYISETPEGPFRFHATANPRISMWAPAATSMADRAPLSMRSASTSNLEMVLCLARWSQRELIHDPCRPAHATLHPWTI